MSEINKIKVGSTTYDLPQGATNLNGLTDVIISSAQADQLLIYKNNYWRNTTKRIPEAYRLYVEINFDHTEQSIQTVKLKQGSPVTQTITLAEASYSDVPHKPNTPVSLDVEWYYLDIDDIRTTYSQEGGWFYEITFVEGMMSSIATFQIPYAVQTSPMLMITTDLNSTGDIVTGVTQFYEDEVNDSENAVSSVAVKKTQIATTLAVDLTNWTTDTTSQSGTTLYKKQITLTNVYVESPSVDIGAGTGYVLPTSAEQESYNLLQYVTVDDTVPCLYLYASEIPSTAFYIKVTGVAV